MKAIVLCLFCFLAISSGMSVMEKYPNSFMFVQKRSIMNVMTQVEAQLKSGGPLDAITRILDEFEQELRQEQIAHDALFEKQTKECNEEFTFRNAEIKNGNEAVEEATDRLNECKANLVRAQNAKAVAKKHLKQKTAELINVHSVRTRQKYNFDTVEGVYGKLRPAVDQCIAYVEKIFTGDASFIQVARHTNQMLIQLSRVGKAHHMDSVLSVLAQVAASEVQADNELLEKLMAIFQQLGKQMDTDMAEIRSNESKAVAQYKEDVARLKKSIASLEEAISDLIKEIAANKKCITVQTNRLNSANAKVLRNTTLLNAAVKMCAAMTKQYHSAKEGRIAELSLLDAIKVKVDEHFAKISAGATARGKLDNFDKTYKNKSAYVKKEFKK